MTAPSLFPQRVDGGTLPGPASAAGDRHRCRWHTGPGRCPHPQAFPGVRDVPELCTAHLTMLEPWIAARAAQRDGHAVGWIAWAQRQAESVEREYRALGGAPPLFRRSPAAGGTP